MKPYQLWPQGPWIDLEHVQEVIPPEFVDRMGHGGFFVEMHVRFAFQGQLRTYSWEQDWKPKVRIETNGSRIIEEDYDPLDCVPLWDGVPSVLAKVEMNVYRPLMQRWAGIRLSGPVVPRGWDHKQRQAA